MRKLGSRVTFALLLVAATLATGVVGYLAVRVLGFGPTAVGGDGRSFGEATIGGPFTLVDGDGKTRTQADFRGKLMLVYFGYAFCPDVCPTELQKMGEAMDALGDKAKDVVPVFITVDPERDTPTEIKTYVGNFHPRMVGLTGTQEQVAAAARAWRVYYKKVDNPAASQYTMDHTSIVYLMDRQGKFITHFSGRVTADEMSKAIGKYL
jgi:protein SCO1/2